MSEPSPSPSETPPGPPGVPAVGSQTPRSASPGYFSARVNPQRDARLAWHLRLAAGLMAALALLVTWGLIDQFVIRWHRVMYRTFIQGRFREWPGPFEAALHWGNLIRIMPALVILLIFAGVYLFHFA